VGEFALRSRKGVVFFALLGEIALVGPTRAADGQTSVQLGNLPIEQLMQFEIESASKHPQKLSDVPAVVSIVTHEDIEAHGYRTLGDILSSMRGLYISYDRNYQYLGVRGFSIAGDYNTRVLMLVDGVRYNDSVYDQAPVGTDFNVDVDLIERVEFISGPASAVYGSNALYGVINVITRNGSDFKGLNVATSVESYDGSKGRVTLGETTAGGGSWLVSLTRHNQPGQDIRYQEFNTPEQNGGVAKDADYDRSTSFFAKYRQDDLSVTLTHGERVKGVPTASFGQAFNNNDARTTDTRTHVGMEYRGTLAATSGFVARLYGGTSDYRGDYVYDDPSPYINRDESEGRWVGSEVQVTRTFARHNLVGGIEYRRDMRIDQANFDLHPPAVYVDDRRSGEMKSLYIQDEYRPVDDLIFNTGVRFDKNSNSSSTINPRLGVIYKLDAGTVAKLLYGTAFRTPNEYERSYFPAFHGMGASPYGVDPDLDRERLKSMEILLEHSFTSSQRAGFSVFQNEIKDHRAGGPSEWRSLFHQYRRCRDTWIRARVAVGLDPRRPPARELQLAAHSRIQ
jgi:iron complex outermembrane receptor protein